MEKDPNMRLDNLMNEQLKSTESLAWNSAVETVDAFIKSENITEAKCFAQETINNWKETGKTDRVENSPIG